MNNFWRKWQRRLAVLAGTGMLFQASSCSTDAQALASEVATYALTALLGSLGTGP